MKCQWQKLLDILPRHLREDVDKLRDLPVQEIHMRLGYPPGVVMENRSHALGRRVVQEDILWVVNQASRYSPWNAQSMAMGYLTAPGGHRIGLCGDGVVKNGVMTGLREIRSLNIRVARQITGLSSGIPLSHSLLIIGAPGWGKTTLLRDIITRISETGTPISVVDERLELFPPGFSPGENTDVLSGCPKVQGIQTVLRTMGPQWIGVDEVTGEGDCHALLQAGWCGVKLVATAHAASVEDLKTRPIYRPLLENGLFSRIVVLKPDRTWTQEEVVL